MTMANELFASINKGRTSFGGIFIEAAISLPLLILFLGALLEFSRWLVTYQRITVVAYEAARIASATPRLPCGPTPETHQIINKANMIMARMKLGGIVSAELFGATPGAGNAGNSVRATVTTGFGSAFGGFAPDRLASSVTAPYLFAGNNCNLNPIGAGAANP